MINLSSICKKEFVLGELFLLYLDTDGRRMVQYVYDAWGNHKIVDGYGNTITSSTHIGIINPIRYRSYYYDTETGLYYLQARYYDPVIGRFISTDDVDYIDPEVINGLNLYAYCGNNPVMNIDPSGHSFTAFLIGFLIFGGLAFGATVYADYKDDGQVFIGCAGGIDTLAKMHYTPATVSAEGRLAIHIKVSGLMGGHSGDDINKGRGNANKILVRFLYQVMHATEMYLATISGGNLRNAIAREAEAVITIPMAYKEDIRVMLNHYIATIEAEIGDVEKDFAMSLETTDMPELFIPADKAKVLIQALYACPHGMTAMSKTMPGLVETSTNLASVKMKEDDKSAYIEVNTSQRSSIESKKHDIKQMVECALALACDEVTHGDGYPGWAPNPQSALLEVTKKAYADLFDAEPKVLAIHAGLECGLFLEKYPYLDMVSIGPQMFGVHSPQERLNITSTGKCWEWLKRVLETL